MCASHPSIRSQCRCRQAFPRSFTGVYGWVFCAKNWQLELRYKGRAPAIKEQIVDMSLNGSGIRDTARVLKISTTTVINTLKKKNRRSPR